jgi:D-galactonate transporter
MSTGSVQDGAAFERAVYRKLTWRLMPYLFLCYILAYVDRVNVGFAKLQMQQDLRMSDSVFGAGAGIFFIGYFIFEVPANIMLQKIGARRWLGPIMIVWGVVSACTMFVSTTAAFYGIRFLLGIVESGFFPGVILYLTFWFTRSHRAKMVAVFMSAVPLAGVVAGPISGWILESMTGVGHLSAWQWLFLAEGVPSVIAGFAALVFLTDSPAKASWLTDAEKRLVLDRLREEEELKQKTGAGGHRLIDAFRDPKVWLLCLVYFGFTGGNYGLGFWLPQVIKDTVTKDPLLIGWISVIPWAAATIGMLLAGHHSDATGERRWHVALSGILMSVAFAISAIPGISGVAGLVALTFAAVGIMCALSLFWSLPTSILSGAAAAAGIAWINSVGNLAGYLSPFMVGKVRDATHSMTLALLTLSAVAMISAIATLYVTRKGAMPRS